MPLSELMERMSGAEFGLHWAQYRAQPWGEEAEEVNAAVIAHTVANMSGRMRKDFAPLEEFKFFSGGVVEKVELDPLEWARKHG